MSNRAVRVGALGVVVAIGGFVACSSDSSGKEVTIASSSNPANVVIELKDDAGKSMGSCTGILVSSNAVLTAGHCVVAAKQWAISTLNGKQTANGSQVFTTWEDFESNWSHPLHSDIGVIVLDQAIYLPKYPNLAVSLVPDGTRLSRVRRVDPLVVGSTTQFEEVAAPVLQGQEKGFPLAYGIDPSLAEGGTDTGGALYDPGSNLIFGIVSGKGLSTGRYYVSRVDYLATWISAISQCNPAPRTPQCHPSSSSSSGSGSGSGSSSSSSSSGSSSSGSSTSSSGSSSSSSSSGSGGSSGCSGSSGSSGSSSSGSSSSSSGSGGSNGSSGSGGSNGSSGSSSGWGGSNGGSNGGSSGSGGSSSGSSSGGGGCNPPPPPPPPTNSDGGCDHPGGSTSSSGGSTSGGSTSSSSGMSSSSGSSSGGGVTLIPDGPGCTTNLCGGCKDNPNCQDNQQDYGNCGCTPNPPTGREAGPNQ